MSVQIKVFVVGLVTPGFLIYKLIYCIHLLWVDRHWPQRILTGSEGKGYKPEGKPPEVEEKLSVTLLLIHSGDPLPPEFAQIASPLPEV